VPCGHATRGLLGRRPVAMDGGPKHVGKESNRLEARMREEVERESDYLNVYDRRACSCGCGALVSGRAHYFNAAHKQKGVAAESYRLRRRWTVCSGAIVSPTWKAEYACRRS
jgi:hypothetical protein